MVEEVILIDFSWVYNKYYYATTYNQPSKSQLDKSKNFISCLYRFFTLLRRNKEYKKIYVVLDGKLENTYNKRIYPDYKATRGKKDEVYKDFQDMVKILTTLPTLEIIKDSNEEADYVIAHLAKKLSHKNKIVIFSGDKDLLQLASLNNVVISDKYKNGKFEILQNEDIFKKFKNNKKEDFTRFTTDLSYLTKYRVFQGDVSDNIPKPIPLLKDREIGEILKVWKEDELDNFIFEDIVKSVNNEKLSLKLTENKDSVFLNFQLMDLIKDRDIKLKKLSAPVSKVEVDKINKLKEKYDLKD